MSILGELWPFLLAAFSMMAFWISNMRANAAIKEAEAARNSEKASLEVIQALKKQQESIKEGEKLADEIIKNAHVDGSAGDLTKSDY